MDLEHKIVSEKSKGATTTWYIVIGERGAVQFMMLRLENRVIPLDVGVHSKEPLFDGHDKDVCDIMGECYFTPSYAKAKDLYDAFNVDQDPAVIWQKLEFIYKALFTWDGT